MTYPKRTIDLQPGDILCMYGARDRVESVESVHPERRYSAVTIMAQPLGNGDAPTGQPARSMTLDNAYVAVQVPRGHRVIAVPID